MLLLWDKIAEKALVMDMLKAAIASKDEYYKQPENVADFVRTPMAAEEYKRPQTGQNLPPERGIGDERVSQHIDRYINCGDVARCTSATLIT